MSKRRKRRDENGAGAGHANNASRAKAYANMYRSNVSTLPRQAREAYFPLCLILSTSANTPSSPLSLTLLQSVSYTFFTTPSNSRFHRSLAISASPTGTSRYAGSGSAFLGS